MLNNILNILNNIPERLLRAMMEKFMPLLAFFLFLSAVSLILSFVVRYFGMVQ